MSPIVIVMKGFELFIFLLCVIVLVALTTFFTVLITIIARQQLRLIRCGKEDEKIKKSVLKKNGKTSDKVWGVIDKIVSALLCCFLLVVLIISVSVGVSGNKRVVKNVPAVKVISSTSMAIKYEKNTYLFDNNLNNQLQLFDLVVLHELPKEEDIKLYDIIVYETPEGVLVIHRVIGIEEPNEKHPNERWFQFKGDSAENADRFPVRYSQMKSIYRGERIPNVGSFVFFMQSPAGLICFALVILVLATMPFVDRKFTKEQNARIKILVEAGELPQSVLEENSNKCKDKGENDEKE